MSNTQEVTNELVAFRRPVALYLPQGNRYLAWLSERQRGRKILRDEGGVVWLIDASLAAVERQR